MKFLYQNCEKSRKIYKIFEKVSKNFENITKNFPKSAIAYLLMH